MNLYLSLVLALYILITLAIAISKIRNNWDSVWAEAMEDIILIVFWLPLTIWFALLSLFKPSNTQKASKNNKEEK